MNKGCRALVAALTITGAAAAPAAALPPTTEDRTITGNPAAAYSQLQWGPGWSRIVRDPSGIAGPTRTAQRTSLLYFSQLSDFQLADEETPAKVEFVDVDNTPVTAAWRPQEGFGPQTIDHVIRQVNQFTTSPHTQGDGSRAQMHMSITTGDSADSQQFNEVEWVVRLLEGGSLDPNSGVESELPCPAGQIPAGEAARYTGVQDHDDYTELDTFYDPDRPAGLFAQWPSWPGLMDRAQKPFEAQGLAVPSYVSFGNHDALVQGNAWANAGYEAIATGCAKVYGYQTLPAMGANPLLTSPEHVAAVPADPKRRYVDEAQYRSMHATGAQADAHGFGYVDPAELAASDGAAGYYAWSPKPGFRFIALDTVSDGGVIGPSAEGNIDHPQYLWVQQQLAAAQAANELIVLFGHHPFRSLTAEVPDELAPPCLVDDAHGHDVNPGCDRDPRSSLPLHLGPDMQALFAAHRNVIAYVAGHTHEHNVDRYTGPQGNVFWGIESSSEVDWPIQSRLLEVMDNQDGTLSILGTLIDHGAPISTPPAGSDASTFTETDLAAIAREISFNDYQAGGTYGTGQPDDRNVELLLPDPRIAPPALLGGGSQFLQARGGVLKKKR